MDSESKIWQRIREDNNYFVNRNFLKYGVSNDNSDFEKRNKALWVFVPALVLVCLNAVIMMFGHSILVGIPSMIVSVIAFVWILRKFVFDERNFKKLMAENNTNNEISINGPLNNLLSIDENNQWFFQNDQAGLRSSYLITFDYASLLDLSLSSTRISVEDALAPFIRELHNNNFEFTKYDISIKHRISLGTLKEIQQTKLLQQGSWLRLVEQLQNETLSSLEQNSSNTYKIYYLISNNDFKKLPNFKPILKSIIDSTLITQNSIIHPRIANVEEVINFITNYYQISSFDPYNIKRNIQHMDISKYFDFTGFFDVNGVNYRLEDFIDDTPVDNSFGMQPLNERKLTQLERDEKKVKEQKAQAKEVKNKEDERKRFAKLVAENKSKQNNKTVGVYKEELFDRNAVLKVKQDEAKKELNKKRKEEIENRKTTMDDMKNLGASQNLTLEDLINRKNKNTK